MVIGTPKIGMDLMRGYCRAGLAFAALTLSAPAIADEGKPIRTAKVFLMGATVVPGSVDQAKDAQEPDNTSGFRLLDLARDRVKEAMRESFGTGAPGSTTAPALADGEGEQAALSPYSDIVVPGWMRAPLLSGLPATRSFVPGCMAVPYRPSGFLPIHVEARRRAAYDAMSAAACEAGIPVGLFDALVLSESAYDAYAVSPKGAYGRAQLMRDTAAGLGVDRFDPVQNLRGGAFYLRAQLDSFGQVPLALAAYNAGPGRVKGGRIPAIAETRNYVRDVLDKWLLLAGQHRIVSVTAFGGGMKPPVAASPPVQTASVQHF